MPANPRDVFEAFTRGNGEDDPPEVALLAYGAFSAELYEWVEHEEQRQGRPPKDEEINAWIAQIPDARLKRIRDEALESFGLAARAFLEREILRQRKEAVDQSILSEIQRFTSGFRAFGINVAAGIVAAFLLHFSRSLYTISLQPIRR
jgi:hypothetical protein